MTRLSGNTSTLPASRGDWKNRCGSATRAPKLVVPCATRASEYTVFMLTSRDGRDTQQDTTGATSSHRVDEAGSLRPFLRWAGSKRQLLPILVEFWRPGFTRYIEPFLGSGTLYWAIAPEAATLSDVNADVIDAFGAVKESPQGVHEALCAFEVSREAYARIRSLDPRMLTPSQRGARVIYLMRFCFNGIYRTDKQGRFNVPFSGGKTGSLPSLEHLVQASAVLQKAEIKQQDFQEALRTAGRGDFVYLDPPYAGASHRSACQFGPGSFQSGDVERLVRCLHELDSRGARFLLSYGYSEEIMKACAEWECRVVGVRRNVAGQSRFRRDASEVLVTNRSRK